MNRIIYDYQIFLQQKYGGVSRYFYELALRMEKIAGFTASIYAPLYTNAYLAAGHAKRWGIKVAKTPKIWRAYELVDRAMTHAYLANAKPAIVHETYYSNRRLAPRQSLVVVTVYDMIHEKFRHMFDHGDPTTSLKRKSVERAAIVICISENTRRDLIELFDVPEEKTVTVPLGFGLDRPLTIDGIHHRPAREPYLLYVGNRDFHKNFLGLLKAYASSRVLTQNFRLVCFGGPAMSKAELGHINELRIPHEKIEWRSGNDAVLAGLYRNAAAFVYPSLYEGFGIPPLEAMSNDCPVLCGDTSSMPEVVGDAAMLFEPHEPDDIRRAIEEVVGSDAVRQRLVERGRRRIKEFSWDRCAAETASVYSNLLQ